MTGKVLTRFFAIVRAEINRRDACARRAYIGIWLSGKLFCAELFGVAHGFYHAYFCLLLPAVVSVGLLQFAESMAESLDHTGELCFLWMVGAVVCRTDVVHDGDGFYLGEGHHAGRSDATGEEV